MLLKINKLLFLPFNMLRGESAKNPNSAHPDFTNYFNHRVVHVNLEPEYD